MHIISYNKPILSFYLFNKGPRGASRPAATSKMESFTIIVNGFQPLIIITKRSILDVVAALDLPLSGIIFERKGNKYNNF